MSLLFHLYPLLSVMNDRKHKVAFVLGKFARISISNRVAEKLLVESLVLMDMKGETIPPPGCLRIGTPPR